MGYNFADKAYLDEFDRTGEPVRCPGCEKRIVENEQVYFTDFGQGKAEHFLCFWKKREKEKTS
jgi:hypothetical protein